MDTHQLEVYIAAAQYLNFTKASKQLNMVPSAVSHSISMLEHELDTKLFVRDNNKLNLTEAGYEFLKDAIRITTIANNARNRVKTTGGEESGSIRIGFVFPEFVMRYVPLMTSYCEEHPYVDLSYLQYDSISVTRMLSDQKLDVAFGREGMFSSDSRLQWRGLYVDPFYVVMHKDHPLAQNESITIPMLKREQILVMNRGANPGMFDMIQTLFLSHNLTPNLNDYSNHHLTTLMMAAMKLGVVIIPNLNFCFKKLPDDLVHIPLEDPMAFHEIGIAWNQDNVSVQLLEFLSKFGIMK